MSPFADWQNFYMIMGSAAAALTGLQFVAMALIADLPSETVDPNAASAFSTPSLIHFGSVLFLAAVMVMPWNDVMPVAIILGLTGLAGAIYTAFAIKALTLQTSYKPVFEDWLFRIVLPMLAYLALVGSASFALCAFRPCLFSVAAAALLLLFVGIHNAWDNVTYIVFVRGKHHN